MVFRQNGSRRRREVPRRPAKGFVRRSTIDDARLSHAVASQLQWRRCSRLAYAVPFVSCRLASTCVSCLLFHIAVHFCVVFERSALGLIRQRDGGWSAENDSEVRADRAPRARARKLCLFDARIIRFVRRWRSCCELCHCCEVNTAWSRFVRSITRFEQQRRMCCVSFVATEI